MIYHLSGIARSGSTVLSAILNQNPQIHVSGTSPLVFLVEAIQDKISTDKIFEIDSFSTKKFLGKVCKGLAEGMYSDIDKSIILDKSRGWIHPRAMQAVVDMNGGVDNVKIIVTVRNVADCISSYIRITKTDIRDLLSNDKGEHLIKTTILQSYFKLFVTHNTYPNCLHYVEYENLLKNPEKELNKIHKFLNLPYYKYDFNNIQSRSIEFEEDKVWQIPDLHKIAPTLKKQHSNKSTEMLKSFYSFFIYPEFWKGDGYHSKYLKEIKAQPLYMVSKLIEKGDLKTAYDKIKLLYNKDKTNPFYNQLKGYFLHSQGQIKEAGIHFNNAKKTLIFHNDFKLKVNLPEWDGKRKDTILVVLEGFEDGDQVYYSRYVSKLNDIGCKVILVSSDNLVNVLSKVNGVMTVIGRSSIERFLPSLRIDSIIYSTSLPLYFEDEQAKYFGPYINLPKLHNKETFKIGVCIQSSIQQLMLHSLHKYVYPELPPPLNQASIDYVANNVLDRNLVISLLDKYKLNYHNFNDQNSSDDKKLNDVGAYDIIITDSNNICNLAGAIGVKVWYITPFFGNYLFSSDKFKPYDMEIFRQQKIYNWQNVLKDLELHLKKLI
jgi:sulfotransferase